jgi:uncharacterized protein YbaR (Trm112 family)
MIRPELLELLRCPETHQRLRHASGELLARVNDRINKKELRNRAGKILEQPLESALIREDDAVVYPVRGNLPILLIDEAVPLVGS